MALTAKFQADFSTFYDAVTKAEVSLKSFETGAGNVEKSLTRMGNAFSGVKVIQDAHLMTAAMLEAGGMATLTDNELKKLGATVGEASEKMRLLGMEVPPGFQRITDATKDASDGTFNWKSALVSAAGAFGVAFSVNALKDFIVGVVETASHIGDLSTKLGVSTDAVQKWDYAAKLGGTSIETIDRAVTNMNRTLSAGGTVTADILKKINLEFEDLHRMSPEAAFDAITKAISTVENPMLRAEAATKLFGKAGAELLPAIKAGFAGVAEGTEVMSADTIASLKKAEDAWTALGHHVTIISGGLLANITSLEHFGISTDNLAGAMARVKSPILAAAAAANDLGMTEGEVADAIGHLDKEINESIVLHQKHKDALDELRSAGEGWKGTLALMNGETVAGVRYYLDAGVSQAALAEAYTLTATQVKAVASFMTEQQAIQKKGDQGILETIRVWDEYDALLAKRSGTSTDAQIAQIKRWADDLTARVHKAGADTADFYDALAATSKAKMDDILIDWTAISGNSSAIYQRNLQQVADKAQATFQYMLDNADKFSVGTINKFQDIAIAAQQAADNWSGSFENAGDKATAAVEKTAAAVSKAMSGLTGVSVMAGDTTNEERMRHTVLTSSDPYLDYERFKAPNTGGNAVTVNMNGMLTSSDPSAQAQLRQLINDAVMAGLRNTGNRFASGA